MRMREALKKTFRRSETERYRRAGARIGGRFLPNGAIISPNDCPFVTIGNYVTFGPGVMILTHDAALRDHIGWTRVQPVEIEDEVFIGARSTILPGVLIGRGSIIAAGSVVTKSIPRGEVWGGVPARPLADVATTRARNLAAGEHWPRFDQGWKAELDDPARSARLVESVKVAGGGWFY